MLILLSPSKSLNIELEYLPVKPTLPRLKETAVKIAMEMKKLSKEELMKKMNISEKIAELNYQRYQKFEKEFNKKNSKPAIYAFNGDVYRDIEVRDYSAPEIKLLQKQVRILSGLYGILRPFDLIQPYRLEMKYKTDFWKDKLTEYLIKDLRKENEVLNLASKEYSKPIDFSKLKAKVYHVEFKEVKNGQLKTIAIYSKLARGTMTNWITRKGITKVEDITKFKEDYYSFNKEASTEDTFVFSRKQ